MASCAYEGVIVRKDSSPLPLYESVGVDGSYKLALRDRTGAVRSQLVTPEVFEGYAEGEYFNDLQSAPSGASAAAKGMASAGSANTGALALARGTLGNGNRYFAKTAGTARRASIATVQHAPAAHALATVHRTAAPSVQMAATKTQSLAVTAHFSVALPTTNPAPVIAPNPHTSSTAYVVASKTPTTIAPRAHLTAQHPVAKKTVSVSTAKTSKPKHLDPSRSAHAARSAQIPLVR